MNTFFSAYDKMYRFRDDYTAISIITNGLHLQNNQITAFAYARVQRREVTEAGSVLFDWTKRPTLGPAVAVDQHIRDQEAVERGYLNNGIRVGVNREKLQREGLPPFDALAQTLIVIEDIEERDELIVMHNAFHFEVPFLEYGLNTWFTGPMGERFFFDEANIYDAGMVEKASQLPNSWKPLPRAGESPREYAYRIGSSRVPGVLWGLVACDVRYGLHAQAGLDPTAPFHPQTKALEVHRLYESHRQQISGEIIVPA